MPQESQVAAGELLGEVTNTDKEKKKEWVGYYLLR